MKEETRRHGMKPRMPGVGSYKEQNTTVNHRAIM